MTPLRQRMIEDMKLQNLSPRTIEAYVMRAAGFARYFRRSPGALGREEVRSYLLHLVQEKKVSWSVYNQTVAALKFLYEVTLNREGVMVRVRCPKQPKKLPTVLSLDETARFFAAILSVKHRAILMAAYAAGLRLSEVVGLRVAPSVASSPPWRTQASFTVCSLPALESSGSSTLSPPQGGRSRSSSTWRDTRTEWQSATSG